MSREGQFRMTRAQAQSLSRALRSCSSWQDLPPGDVFASLVHEDAGLEVQVTIYRVRPVAPKVIRGFRRDE